MVPMDLHTHSNRSDGTCSPSLLVEKAKAAGLGVLALTDHDCIQGLPEALDAGARLGIRVIPGLELDTEFPTELHMLGLGVDPQHPALQEFAARNALRRQVRNEKILAQLAATGTDVRPFFPAQHGTPTRLHVALALVAGGFAPSIPEAFRNYLFRGRPGYVETKRILPEDAIALIHQAGGLAILAHPCKIKADVAALVARLHQAGLDGLEAFYPTATPGQRETYISMAQQYGMLLSCGSDFHGDNRPDNVLGSTWQDTPLLAPIQTRLLA